MKYFLIALLLLGLVIGLVKYSRRPVIDAPKPVPYILESKMNYLVVWQHVPENTKVFFLRNIDAEDQRKLQLCNGNYLNTIIDDAEVEAALNWLSVFLLGRTPIYNDTKKEDTLPLLTPLDLGGENLTIIITGFLM